MIPADEDPFKDDPLPGNETGAKGQRHSALDRSPGPDAMAARSAVPAGHPNCRSQAARRVERGTTASGSHGKQTGRRPGGPSGSCRPGEANRNSRACLGSPASERAAASPAEAKSPIVLADAGGGSATSQPARRSGGRHSEEVRACPTAIRCGRPARTPCFPARWASRTRSSRRPIGRRSRPRRRRLCRRRAPRRQQSSRNRRPANRRPGNIVPAAATAPQWRPNPLSPAGSRPGRFLAG